MALTWNTREFDAAYRRYAPLVQRRARALLGCDAEALDVVQDLFAALFERPERFRAESSFSTYLYAATTHACWTRLRNRRKRASLLERRGPAAVSCSGRDAEALLELRELLGRLDERLAQVAVFYYLDEMTHAEIAELLGCSRRQVGYLLERLHTVARSERRLSS